MLAFLPICNRLALCQVCCDLWLRHGSTAYSSMAKLWGAPNFLLNGPSLVHLKEQERGPEEALSRIIVKKLEALHLNREALAQPKASPPVCNASVVWYTLYGGEAEAKRAPGQNSARSNRIMCLQRMIRLQCIVRHLHQRAGINCTEKVFASQEKMKPSEALAEPSQDAAFVTTSGFAAINNG